MSRHPRCLALFACAGLFAAPAAASLTLLGFAPGTSGSYGYGISADGAVVTGFSNGSPNFPGFTWSASQGRYDFGLESGLPTSTNAHGVSGDGSTVVGEAFTGSSANAQAFRWQAGSGGPGTFQSLGTLGTARSYAQGTNRDGSVVVGHVETGTGLSTTGQPFVWTQSGGMVGLRQYLPPQFYGEARAVSRDGSTTAGFFFDLATGGSNAFTFSNGQAHVLDQLPGTNGNKSKAFATNDDGSIVVGRSGFNSLTPTIWRGGVPEALPLASGYVLGVLLGVSDDGTVAVGQMQSSGGTLTAGIWTPGRGMEPLSVYLASIGIDVPAGWLLREASGISADGLAITGIAAGDAVEAFVVRLPSPASAAILCLGALGLAARRRR